MIAVPTINGTLPFCGPSKVTYGQIVAQNVVLIFCMLFYMCVAAFGFRNVYVILWRQRKYKSTILALVYFFGQSICLMRIAQDLVFLLTYYKAEKGHYCAMTD